MLRLLACVFVLFSTTSAFSQETSPIRINEIFADGSSKYPDWIELYNTSSKTIDLKGYSLSDKPDKVGWKIRDHITIAAKHLRVFVCDAKGAYDHTGFRLSSISGEVALYSPTKQLLDSITYGDVPRYHSLGRYPDGTGALHLHANPTMGTSNQLGQPQVASEVNAPPAAMFSHDSGRYSKPFQLTIQPPKGGYVYYTRDGKLPDQSSARYSQPLTVKSTTVLRAVVRNADGRLSHVETRSYIFGEEHTRMPVISLTTDPENLWNEDTGIYTDGAGISNIPNWKHGWRRPIHVDYLGDDGNWSASGEVRIFGGASRGRPQKSFAIYVKGHDSANGIRFKLFPNRDLEAFPGFILRNGGDEWLRSQIQDAFLTELAHGRTEVDDRPYRPAIAYLNGSYWGLYGLRGLEDKAALLTRHGLPEQKVILKDGGTEIVEDNGPFGDYTPVAPDGPYEGALRSMDFNSYLDYMCVELFIGNRDWVDGNIKCWRIAAPQGKWRWILYDLDRSFSGKRTDPVSKDPFLKLLTRSGRGGLMLSELLKNKRFARDFSARMNTHMLTTFEYGRMQRVLADITTQIRPQLPRHFDRWRWQWDLDRLFVSIRDWEAHLDNILEYGRKRPAYMFGFLQKYCGFEEPQQTSLSVRIRGKGSIRVEGIPVPEGSFAGPVLGGLSLNVEAVPAPGYAFLKWQNHSTTEGPVLRVRSGETLSVDAIFVNKKGKKHE